MSNLDNYGFFGPEYSFADNIPLPGQIGVRNESSVGAIIDAVAGVNYYVDTIAFGGPTFFDSHNPRPMGLRHFMNTGLMCSNGATMSEYFDGVTRGDLLGDHVAKALASAGLPGLRGLAPGILENARDALDPRPLFAAVTSTGYPVCQQVLCPVGDIDGNLRNQQDASQNYIVDPVEFVQNVPYQRRWVGAYDSTGAPLQITKDEFAATPKCYNPDGTYRTNPPSGCAPLAATDISEPAGSKYPLCRMTQPAAVPSTVTGSNSGSEGFTNGGDTATDVGVAVAVAILGGIGLWSLFRNR
jgi:hypothetical protein